MWHHNTQIRENNDTMTNEERGKGIGGGVECGGPKNVIFFGDVVFE